MRWAFIEDFVADRESHDGYSRTMKTLKVTLPRLMTLHFIISILILFLAAEGFSHRSTLATNLIQIPLFIWPVWFFFLGKGWRRAASVSVASLLSLVMLGAFLTKDENQLDRRRFTTSLGQAYIVQQFDFDHSKELPDQIELEQPLGFGFLKALRSYISKNPSIGKIQDARVHENSFEIIGTFGSYNFRHDGRQLQLIE